MDEIYGYGYHIVNLVNGKKYAGQTTQPDVRWREHQTAARSGVDQHLYRAMRKVGLDKFSFRLVFQAHTKEELDDWEVAEIASLGLLNPAVGYNKAVGGSTGRMGPEAARKHKDSCTTEDYRSNARAMSKARWRDPEYQQVQGAAHKAALNKPGYRRGMSERSRAFYSDPAKREDQRRTMVELWSDPELRKAQSILLRDPEIQRKRLLTYGLPRIMAHGVIYDSFSTASKAIGVNLGTVKNRLASGLYLPVPRYDDRDCDAVEECWALMQHEKKPDHYEQHKAHLEAQKKLNQSLAQKKRWDRPGEREASGQRTKAHYQQQKTFLRP